MDAERERGFEAGRRWAERASAHELASMVGKSFDEICQSLPPDLSDDFVGGFREAVLHRLRGA